MGNVAALFAAETEPIEIFLDRRLKRNHSVGAIACADPQRPRAFYFRKRPRTSAFHLERFDLGGGARHGVTHFWYIELFDFTEKLQSPM